MPLNFLRNCFAIEDEPSYPRALHTTTEEYSMSSVSLGNHMIPEEEQGRLGDMVATPSHPLQQIDPEMRISLTSTHVDSEEEDDENATSSDESSISKNSTTQLQLNVFILLQHFFHNLGGDKSSLGINQDSDGIGSDRDDDEDVTHLSNVPNSSHVNEDPCVSPLRTATNYSSCTEIDDIPSIALEEVVMPGSRLQKSMSLTLQRNGVLSESKEDECVICMEAFDDANPRIPTKCACGENRTFFHLPCLYMYRSKCKECPICRETLSWKEF